MLEHFLRHLELLFLSFLFSVIPPDFLIVKRNGCDLQR